MKNRMQGTSPLFRSRACRQAEPLLWDYAAGQLETADADRVREHLAACPRCRARAERWHTASAALAAHGGDPPGGIPERAGDWRSLRTLLADPDPEPAWQPGSRARLRPVLLGGGALALGGAVWAAAAPAVLLSAEMDRLGGTDAPPAPSQQAAAAHPPMANALPTRTVVAAAPAAAPRAQAGPIEAAFVPFFAKRHGDGPWPIRVRLRSHVDSETPVTVRLTLADHPITRRVTLPAGGDQLVTFYPTLIADYCSVSYEVKSPYGTQRDSLPVNYDSDYNGTDAWYIGDRNDMLPSVYPKQHNDTAYSDHRPWIARASVVPPDRVVDRSTGFDQIRYVVLDQGAEKMNAAQWSALRAWLVRGGSVIALDSRGPADWGAGGAAVLPAAGESLPTLRLANVPTGPLARGHAGAGTVLYVGGDMTAFARQTLGAGQPEVRKFWSSLLNDAYPIVDVTSIQNAGSHSPWQDGTPGMYPARQRLAPPWDPRDPFALPVPPLNPVIGIFLAYFVLVIPVTFVVLRRTGRANLAWVTGPAFAALTSVGICTLALRLYMAPLSRRTAGVLIAEAGDKTAQASGFTEMFFPWAGTYRPVIAGAQRIDNGVRLDEYYANSASAATSGFELQDDGAHVSLASGLSVSPHAFVRLGFEQEVSLGDGLTADLRRQPDGSVTGTVHNGTGRTLSEARLLLPTTDRRLSRSGGYVGNWGIRLGDLPPGDTPLHARPDILGVPYEQYRRSTASYPFTDDSDPNALASYLTLGRYNDDPEKRPTPASPLIFAKLSGETLGATNVGEWKGGDRSVSVLIRLPAIPNALDRYWGKSGASAAATTKGDERK